MGSLQDKINASGNAHDMLYHSSGGVFQFPVQAEFTNWRDEQDAWRSSAIFQDMSHHMCNFYFEGADIFRLLADFGINSFAGFGAMQAKQYVCVNGRGQYIGDSILTCEEDGEVCIVGKPPVGNWLNYQLQKGGYDARLTRFDPPSPRLADRAVFRFQVQGPNAGAILEQVNGGPLPDIPFFHMGRFKIGPFEITALNHRMSGAVGFEIWGPASQGEEVRDIILRAGAAYDLRRIGGLLYPITATESGWMGSVIPAIYSGADLEDYRNWLPANGYEASSSIGGSFPRGDMEELYLNPYELGYGFMAKYDHRFHGDEALSALAKGKRRKKARLVWNSDDAMAIHQSLFSADPPFKYMAMPNANYCTFPMDEVRLGEQRVGVAFYPVYSRRSRAWISLAAIDETLTGDGQEVSVTWGEAQGGSRKPGVERHRQKQVRVTVDAQPIKRD